MLTKCTKLIYRPPTERDPPRARLVLGWGESDPRHLEKNFHLQDSQKRRTRDLNFEQRNWKSQWLLHRILPIGWRTSFWCKMASHPLFRHHPGLKVVQKRMSKYVVNNILNVICFQPILPPPTSKGGGATRSPEIRSFDHFLIYFWSNNPVFLRKVSQRNN